MAVFVNKMRVNVFKGWMLLRGFTTHKLLYYVCMYVCISVFLINSYGAPLAKRASYLAQHSFLFGPDGTVNYGYIVTNSINSLLTGSRCILNGTHTNHVEPIWPMLQNVSKTVMYICMYVHVCMYVCISVFFINPYGASLAQRASYLVLHSSLFGLDGTVNYGYIVTNSTLLIGSRCIPNGTHTNHVEPIWPMLQNISKTLMYICMYVCMYNVLV